MNNVEKSARQFAAYLNGGKGSGNWNHRGRKGLVGGSAPKGKGSSSYLSSSDKKRIKNLSETDFDAELRKVMDNRQQYYCKRRSAILDGKAESPELSKTGSDLNLASVDQLSKLREFESEWVDENKRIRAEYYKAHYDALTEGYYKDSDGNVYHVVEDFNYPGGFEELKRRQMMYPVGTRESGEYAEYIYDQKLTKVSRNEALGALKDGQTLGGISISEQRIIDAYTQTPLLSNALRDGEDIRSAKELKNVIDRTKGEAGTYYRGVAGDYANELRNMSVGDKFIDKGFASSSLDRGVAQRFTGRDGLIITIISDGGFGTGLQIYSNNPNFMDEQEFLFNQNSEFRILSKNDDEIIVKLEQ